MSCQSTVDNFLAKGLLCILNGMEYLIQWSLVKVISCLKVSISKQT